MIGLSLALLGVVLGTACASSYLVPSDFWFVPDATSRSHWLEEFPLLPAVFLALPEVVAGAARGSSWYC